MTAETATSFHEFPADDGWNMSLGVTVKLHVYEKFYNLWRSGGFETATDYVSHMLLLEEHCQAQFRNPNESDPHNRVLLKEEPLSMEYTRGMLEVSGSGKQQGVTTTSVDRESSPSTPEPADNQVPATVSYAGLPHQRIAIPDTGLLNDIDEVISKSNSITRSMSPTFSLPQVTASLQAKMAGMPPLVPVPVISAGRIEDQYLLSDLTKKHEHQEQLHLTDDDMTALKEKMSEQYIKEASQVQPNSPPRPSIPEPQVQKLPGIGELYKRPVLHGFQTSPNHVTSASEVSPVLHGFQTSPNHVSSASEVSSTSDSVSATKRPQRQKAELARQFIHNVCLPEDEVSEENQPNNKQFYMYQKPSTEDFDDSDFSEDEDLNNNQAMNNRRIECETCLEIFLKTADLMRHYKENVGHQRHLINAQIFVCELCSETMEGRQSMRVHYRQHHPVFYQNKVQKLCSICSLLLPNRHALRQHLKTHESDLTLCPQKACAKIMKKQHITQHLNKVHGDNQVVCDECHKVFRNQMALKAHTQSVHKGFKYVCSFAGCHRSFKRPSTLKVHELIHKDFKPMKCKLCSFRCRQQASISHHFKQHHPGVRPGFLRQSEQQALAEQSPVKQEYKQEYMHHSEPMSPVNHSFMQRMDSMSSMSSSMSPPPPLIPSPEMMSSHHEMSVNTVHITAEVC